MRSHYAGKMGKGCRNSSIRIEATGFQPLSSSLPLFSILEGSESVDSGLETPVCASSNVSGHPHVSWTQPSHGVQHLSRVSRPLGRPTLYNQASSDQSLLRCSKYGAERTGCCFSICSSAACNSPPLSFSSAGGSSTGSTRVSSKEKQTLPHTSGIDHQHCHTLHRVSACKNRFRRGAHSSLLLQPGRSTLVYQYPRTPLSPAESQSRLSAAAALSSLKAHKSSAALPLMSSQRTEEPFSHRKQIPSPHSVCSHDYFERVAALEYYPSYSNAVSFKRDFTGGSVA